MTFEDVEDSDTSNISNAVFGDYESELLLTTIREWAELTQKRSEAAPLQETAAQPTTTEGTATRKSGASGTGDVRARHATPVPSDGHFPTQFPFRPVPRSADLHIYDHPARRRSVFIFGAAHSPCWDRVARMCHERLPAACLSLSPSLRQRPTSLAVTLGRRAEQRVLRRGGIPSGRCSRIQGRVGNSSPSAARPISGSPRAAASRPRARDCNSRRPLLG